VQCNIDERGRAVRLVGGIITLLGGIVLAILSMAKFVEGDLGWLASIAMILGGAFAIFEARKGWCIIRALGIKTPL